MQKVKLFYDSDQEKEIREKINFDPIPAGEVTEKDIWISNDLDYTISVSLKKIEDQDIEISKDFSEIEPGKIKSFELKFSPKITRMEPIKTKLEMTISYIVS